MSYTAFARRHTSPLPLLLALATIAACSSASGPGAPDVVTGDTAAPRDIATDTAAPSDVAADVTPQEDPPASIDTLVPATVRAGEAMMVTCIARSRDGEMVAFPAGAMTTITYAPADAVRNEAGRPVAARAGMATVACALPALNLVDATPAPFRIVPGSPARVVTHLDHDTIVAGETATATCEVTDAYGNVVEGATPTFGLNPAGAGITVTGMRATVERTGMYTAACQLAGAAATPAMLTVQPALPARLDLARSPDRPVYALQEEIEFTFTVTDRFGNAVPAAPVTLTSAPAGRLVRDTRYAYDTEGRFTMTARVAPPTETGTALTAQTTFMVDSTGPGIRCTSPGEGSMIVATVGSSVTLRGALTDTSGVRSVQVDGTPVTLAADGTFSAPVTTRFGMNFVDVSATDQLGIENSRTCVFLASPQYGAEDALLADAVSLRLQQSAVDDGSPISPATSIDDLLQTVLNSPGLATALDAALSAANPIKPSSCDQNVCVLGRCVCVFRSEVRYLSSEIHGPNASTLTLVPGGLRAHVQIRDLRVRLAISGTLSTSGWVNFETVDVDTTFNLSAAGGRPQATVRPDSTTVTVGRITTDFSGLTGNIVDIVARLAQGRVRDLVADMLRDRITDDFGRVLDGVVGGLDISSLGRTFNVPRLEGTGSVALSFGLGLSSLDVTASRAAFGVGTRMTATRVRTTTSRGIAVPPVSATEPTLSTPATVVLRLEVINSALHALWRGGYFDASLTGERFGGTSFRGASAVLSTALPLVASLRTDGRINVDLGAVDTMLTIPGASAAIHVVLAARASAAVTLMGNDLRFGTVTVDELRVNFEDNSMPMEGRTMAATVLRTLLQNFIDQSLNNALPAIPIPGFRVPASLATYGLPAGRELGITSPALAADGARFVLRGGFGVR